MASLRSTIRPVSKDMTEPQLDSAMFRDNKVGTKSRKTFSSPTKRRLDKKTKQQQRMKQRREKEHFQQYETGITATKPTQKPPKGLRQIKQENNQKEKTGRDIVLLHKKNVETISEKDLEDTEENFVDEEFYSDEDDVGFSWLDYDYDYPDDPSDEDLRRTFDERDDDELYHEVFEQQKPTVEDHLSVIQKSQKTFEQVSKQTDDALKLVTESLIGIQELSIENDLTELTRKTNERRCLLDKTVCSIKKSIDLQKKFVNAIEAGELEECLEGTRNTLVVKIKYMENCLTLVNTLYLYL